MVRHHPKEKQGRIFRASERVFESMIAFYGRTLKFVLRFQVVTLLVAVATLMLTVYLYIIIPKGFFPVQDTGVIQGISQAPPTIGSKAMALKQQELAKVILQDPAVESLSSFIGKKNGIMIVDFALQAERDGGKNATDAAYEACLLRFRPINDDHHGRSLGGVPLALGSGIGSELRRPLGISMVGGLIFSQVLTLYTTPVIYIFFDNLSHRLSRKSARPENRGLSGHTAPG
jgi:multidrug efflux pump subunit AcrB